MFPGCPFCSYAKVSDPAWSRTPRLKFNGAWVSSPMTLVTQNHPQVEDTMEYRAFFGALYLASNSLPTLHAALSVHHRAPMESQVITTMQGSLPVARLHALPSEIWTRLGLR